MKPQHQRTLRALYGHPIQHGLRFSDVEGLLLSLGATVELLSGQRLQVCLPGGETTWIHAAAGPHPGVLDEEGVLRLRRFLQQAGIGPEAGEASEAAPRGDQALRLLLQLDHSGARLWRLDAGGVAADRLLPHGVWSTGQRLSHRHDRDLAGQRAPIDFAYLEQLSDAMAAADTVLLVGHGHGQSDLRELLLEHLRRHHRGLLDRVELAEGVDDTACTEGQLLALARHHFGNQPHRRPLQVPGQPLREAGTPD